MGVVIEGNLVNGKVVVNNTDNARRLYGEGYGVLEGDKLVLEPVEAVYLVYNGRLKVKCDDEVLECSRLLEILKQYDPQLWIKFSVYYDLRRRGRIVKPGPSRNSLLMFKGKSKPSKYIVYVVEETVMMELSNLIEWIDMASRMDKDVLLAVVDKHGDITYYEVSRIQLTKVPR